MLATLEAHVEEYEAVVRTYRSELLIVKEDAARLSGLGRNGSQGGRESPISPNRLKTVNIYNALPHLLDNEDALVPALTMGKERYGGNELNMRIF